MTVINAETTHTKVGQHIFIYSILRKLCIIQLLLNFCQ